MVVKGINYNDSYRRGKKYEINQGSNNEGWAVCVCSSCGKFLFYDDSGGNADYYDIQMICKDCYRNRRYE